MFPFPGHLMGSEVILGHRTPKDIRAVNAIAADIFRLPESDSLVQEILYLS